MNDARLTRQLQDLKSSAEARKRLGRAATPSAPDVLRRLDVLEGAAAAVRAVLDELVPELPGLTVSRRLYNGSWVLQATGFAPLSVAEWGERRSWSRLEFRLDIDPRDACVLQIACRATACDADLPGISTQVDLRTGEQAFDAVRAFAQQGSLDFAREMFARRPRSATGTAAA